MKTRKILLGITFLLGSLLFSCKPTEYDTFGDLYGVVSDMDTAEPVAGATVVLSPGGKSLLTGADGRFEYQTLEVQQYTITVQKTGYSTNRKSVTVVAGEKTEANISIRKND